MFRPLVAAGFGVAAVVFSAQPPRPGANDRVFRLAEMNSAAIAALDPARTIMLLPLDPLEEHGPHLPAATDVFETEGVTQRLAARLADSLPAWSVVLMPTVPYGVDGANRIPERPDIRGTFSLRATTLRSMLVDVGEAVADNGFRWLFVVYMHGAQSQAVAVNDATDFVRQSRGITMLNLAGMEWYLPEPRAEAVYRTRFTEEQRARLAFDIHAGMRETSRMLILRPDLVSPDFRTLPDLTVHNFDEMEPTGRSPSYQGYWSAPSLADSTYASTLLEEDVDQWLGLALRAARGEDLTKVRRYPEGEREDANQRSALRSLARQRTLSAQLDRWLSKRNTIVR